MKKNTANKKPAVKPVSRPKGKPEPAVPAKKQYLVYGIMVMLFLTSIIALSPVLKNEFINTWDDGAYVIDNQLLHDLSLKGIVNIFGYGDDFQKLINNYHPLTTLSLALNYQVSGLSPAGYHTTNLVFHGLNAVLAFLFVYLLSRRKILPAVISGLLFAVHPMHVESVAWVSERKDVLYTFFFLAGLVAYLKYLEDEKAWKLIVVFLLFLFSCLSKAMAVPFPVILLLVDYFVRRRFTWRLVVEKVPFFILALVIGFMSVHLQSFSAINKFETFTLIQRIMHASFGLIIYIVKFVYPADLSAVYPYPAITPAGLLPLPFRIAPWVCLVAAGLVVVMTRLKGEISRVIVFGSLFYFFTIALVLQFISVGIAIIADRYTYLPYIGLSFIIGMLTDDFIRRKSGLKYLGYALAACVLIMGVIFSAAAHERAKVWKDDITLWSDALGQYPDGRMNFIYEKRAREYLAKEQVEPALADYLAINSHDPGDLNALESIGRIYGKNYHDLDKSVKYLEKAYALNPKNPSILKGLGVAMGMKGNIRQALDYLLQAYEVDKTDTTLLQNISASYYYLGDQAKSREFERLFRSLKSKPATP